MKTLLLAAFCVALAACGSEDEGIDVEFMMMAEPPASATADTAFEVKWMVHTEGAVHHSEIRVCETHDVADCGLGATESYTSVTATKTEETFAADVSLAAGMYTVVVWAHVDEDPHVSELYNVHVE